MYFLKLLTHLGLVNKMRITIRLDKDTPHTAKAYDSQRPTAFVAHINCETNNEHYSTMLHRQLAMTQEEASKRCLPFAHTQPQLNPAFDNQDHPHILKVASEDPDTIYASLGARPTHCTAPSCAARSIINRQIGD